MRELRLVGCDWPEGRTLSELVDALPARGLKVLVVADMKVGGVLPAALFDKCTDVETLMLYLMGLTGSVPAAIGMLKSLEQLYLSNNLLTSVPPEIGELANLETLWLNNNELEELPKEIGECSSLETLDLSDNQLTTLPAELADCELLEQLDIYDNPFESLPEELEEGGALEENGCNIVREAIN